MRVVGSALGINIHAPEDAYFSYFNSPYIGHNIGSAVDIYPRHQKWGGDVVAPVSGEIVKTEKMRMGRPKQFPTNEFDYVIGILPEESDTDLLRVMHCEPTLNEGETVELGDRIGKAIRSRYFNYWTGPHYHVEILPEESFRRSSKSYPLELDYQFVADGSTGASGKLELLVSSVTDDNIVGYVESLGSASIGNLVGLPAIGEASEIKGILEGGFSHYKLGGVIGTSELKIGSPIHLGDIPVGSVRNTIRGASVFKRGPSIIAFLNNTEIRGLSCFIYPKHYTKKQTPQLILIPKKYGQFKTLFKEGDLCTLQLSCSINMVKAE